MHHSLHVTPLQSSDVHTPLHVSLDWSAVFHFVAPLTDLRVPLHAPSNGSAVFHFATSLTDMHVPLHAPSDRSAVLTSLLLWQTCTPLCMPRQISVLYFTLSLP